MEGGEHARAGVKVGSVEACVSKNPAFFSVRVRKRKQEGLAFDWRMWMRERSLCGVGGGRSLVTGALETEQGTGFVARCGDARRFDARAHAKQHNTDDILHHPSPQSSPPTHH